MKGKITILVGISGSGKSTWARQQWEKDPSNTVIVNRDKIKELLFGYSEANVKNFEDHDLVSSLESSITKYEDSIIYESLEADKHVIIDSTNLKLSHIKRFTYWNVPTEVKDFVIPENKAIENDRKRVKQVGDKEIKKQYRKMLELMKVPMVDFETTTIKQNEDLPSCYIFDIDGTIAIRGDRSQFDWKKVREDKLDFNTSEVMRDLIEAENPAIILCTGRDGIAEFETRRWLDKHGIQFDGLFIRQQGDMRPDWVVKEEMWRKIAKHYYITGIFDDRLQVVRRARALGLKVFNVAYNNF